MANSKRDITIKMEAVSGAITRFYAFLAGKKVIAEDGTEKVEHKDKLSTDQARLKVRVFGVEDAKYKLTIDLPGTARDQELTLQLTEGYHELSMVL